MSKKIKDLDLESIENTKQPRGMFVQLGDVKGKNTPGEVCPNCKGNALVLVNRIVEMEDPDRLGQVTQVCMCPSCRAIATETLELEDFKGAELKTLQRLVKYQPRKTQEIVYENFVGDLD